MSGQQLIQHDAQRIHIARGADLLPVHLLWARVVERERAARKACEIGVTRLAAGLIEQLGDSEIEQTHLPILRHQNIAGLKIAMNDEIGVRILNCASHLQKAIQPLSHTELSGIAMLGDRLAFDVFEREIRLPGVAHARVVQARDVRMRQRCQDVALTRKALGQRVREINHRQL